MNPVHISATAGDLEGNGGRGRYVLLPGSIGRARQFAGHFESFTVVPHSRGHDCYLGQIRTAGGAAVDVAVIATGMGCPSMEIILHELYTLGARRFLRAGTAGSLQPDYVRVGDIVSATGAVRDESTTQDYVPKEVPAMASSAMVRMIRTAAERLNMTAHVHEGIVHCKSSFYAREFGHGPLAEEHKRYHDILKHYGVLATEMETAALFVQGNLYAEASRVRGKIMSLPAVMTGAILSVVAVPGETFMTAEEQGPVIHHNILLALETLRVLAELEHA